MARFKRRCLILLKSVDIPEIASDKASYNAGRYSRLIPEEVVVDSDLHDYVRLESFRQPPKEAVSLKAVHQSAAYFKRLKRQLQLRRHCVSQDI